MAYNIGNDGLFTKSSIFEYMDEFGLRQRQKNIKSTVTVAGTGVSFRNPPHFMNLALPGNCDAHYKTEAAPEYSTFLAIRFAQRFGISNPSPRFVRTIADAFISGSFTNSDGAKKVNFGTEKYGDLAATVATVLLDDETRNIVLDADPTHGVFKEPLLKITGLLRSLELRLNLGSSFLTFSTTRLARWLTWHQVFLVSFCPSINCLAELLRDPLWHRNLRYSLGQGLLRCSMASFC